MDFHSIRNDAKTIGKHPESFTRQLLLPYLYQHRSWLSFRRTDCCWQWYCFVRRTRLFFPIVPAGMTILVTETWLWKICFWKPEYGNAGYVNPDHGNNAQTSVAPAGKGPALRESALLLF